MTKCSYCGKEIIKDPNKIRKRMKYCSNDCMIKGYGEKYREKNKKVLSDKRKKYYNENTEKEKSLARQTRKDNYSNPRMKGKILLQNLLHRRKVKLKALVLYGGNPPKCDCCGETHIEFLTIDHIHGGGRKDRNQIHRVFYQWLINSPIRKDLYRVLCYNCNCSLGHLGYCPHNNNEIREGEDIGKSRKDCKNPTKKFLYSTDEKTLVKLKNEMFES